VRAGAIALLGRREYARGELAAALQRKGYAPQIVAETLSELDGEGLLNDTRYAESLVRQLMGRGQGPVRIRQALQEAGISADLIASVVEAGGDFHALAADTRRRRFGAESPSDWPERARQMRFLQYRGFSKDHIASALGSSGANHPGEAPGEAEGPPHDDT
jgi:regulatory protein